MKLGEAKVLLDQIELRLAAYESAITNGARSGLSESLTEYNDLLERRQKLEGAVVATEEITPLGEQTVSQVHSILFLLESKINILAALLSRKDLDEATKSSVFNQLKVYRDSRDSLKLELSRCFWRTELVE